MKKLTLFSLTWPIFVEFLLLMTLGFVDTFMLSQYDDAAAGAVSAATQITGFLNLVLLIASGGAGVLIAQYIGAGKKIEIEKVVSVSILTNAILGVIVSISMIFFHDDLLGFMKVSSELMPYAKTYLKIVGSFMFIQALMNAMSVTIKSHGRTKEIMYISLAMNLLNIFGDAVFIYGLFGVPVLGVKGIAMATVASRSIAMVLMTIFLFKRIVPLSALKHLVDKPITILKQILRIGLPATAEVISFNLTGIVLVTLLFANIGPEAVIAQAYTTKIIMFSVVFSYSIGNSTQIMVGQLVGQKAFLEAYKTTMRNFSIAITLSILSGLVLIFFGRYFISIFTTDSKIITIAVIALIVDGFLEPGRAFNHIFVYALRGAGDVVFPVIVGVIMGWSLRIGAGYFFGITLGYGYPGFVFGSLIDEWLRGIIMMFRWKSNKWQKKRLV